MLPPFEMHMLADAVVGALGGAAIVGLPHLWRDRHRLIARWRGGGAEPDESTYLPDRTTEEERRKLPAAMASGAAAGAAVCVGFQAGSMALFVLGVAMIALVRLFYTLVEDRADEVGAPPSDEGADEEPRQSRGIEFTTKAFALLTFLAFPVMTLDEFLPLRERFGLDEDGGGLLGWTLSVLSASVLASLLWSGYLHWKSRPNAADIGHQAAYETTREDIFRLLAAFGVSAGFIALLIAAFG